MNLRANIKLRRAIVISLVFFSVFISSGIFVLFRSSLKHDSEHIRIVTLIGEVETGILRSRIWVDEILLQNDDRLLRNLHESILLLKRHLGELNMFLDDEYVKYNSSDFQNFRYKFDQILEKFVVLEKHLIDDTTSSLITSDPILIHTYEEFSHSFKDFHSILEQYLLLDKRQYRLEIVGIMILNTLIILLAGYVILKLTNQLIRADHKLFINTIEVENRERERIAADLHDGLGALMSGLMIHIQVMQKERVNDSSLIADLSNLKSIVSDSLESLEGIINNLNPSVLLRHGLIESLQRLINQINQLGKTQFAVESIDVPVHLDQSKELILFRICSELINNTLKHSGAQEAKIFFRVQRKVLFCKYSDNGKGFDFKPESIERGKSGLYNIMSRVESMEGKYFFNKKQGKGMEVEISIPL